MAKEPVKWFHDRVNTNLFQLHSLEGVIYSGKTKFQTMEIIVTGGFGKCLLLDNKIQSSERDEFIYHEILVHPAMIQHPAPEKVYIAGGGEGATLREILAHPTVKKAVMIDLDEDVITASKKYLPEYSQGSFEDPRTVLRHIDARHYLADKDERFDVIVIDLSEPVEAGPAYLLYTQEFYRLVSQRLTENGVISVQAGSASMNDLLCFSAVYNTLKSVFPAVSCYQADIPSFGGAWGFCLASLKPGQMPSKTEIDRRIAERGLNKLKFYDGTTHTGIFNQPKHIRQGLESQTRIITDDSPLYVYTT